LRFICYYSNISSSEKQERAETKERPILTLERKKKEKASVNYLQSSNQWMKMEDKSPLAIVYELFGIFAFKLTTNGLT
jgi:hypothetical protein